MDTKIKAVSLKKRLVTLFFSMLSISAFTFGGGFVIVTLMKRRFVDDLEWLDENEMLDMTAIAQSCPGAIAVNGAILVGRRVAGAAGIAVATLATVIPPLVILSLVSYFYALFADNPYVAAVLAGMQAGVAAVIVDVVLNLGAGVLKESKEQAKVIRNASRFLTGEAREGSIVTNSNDNRRTYNNNMSSTIQVQQMVVRDEQDVRSLAVEIATLTRRQQRGKGLRMA